MSLQRHVRETEIHTDPATPQHPPVVERTEVVDTTTSSLPLRESKLRSFYRYQQIVYTVLSLVEALIGIRFVLKILGANAEAPFGALMYGVTDPLVAPFRLLFPTATTGAYVLEPEAIVAAIVYVLVAWLLVKAGWLISGLP